MYINHYTKYLLIDDIRFILMLFIFQEVIHHSLFRGSCILGQGQRSPHHLYFIQNQAFAITCTNTLLVFIYQLQITTYKDFKNSMEFAFLNNDEFLFVRRAIYHEYSITLLALFNSPNLKGGVSIFITICPLSLLS